MKIIKGFATIDAFENRNPGQTAILGELSDFSRTYTRESSNYTDPGVVGYQFVSFKAYDTTTNLEVSLSSDQAKEILSMIRECVSYAQTHIRPYNEIDFKSTLLATFYQKIADVQFGVFTDNGNISLPEWLSWKSTANGGNQIKVWMADAAFQTQYDEYHIEVIPPIDLLDHFFFAYGNVVSELSAVTLPLFMEKIQKRKGSRPDTTTRILNFAFKNLLNANQSYLTNWGVALYGQQGDNIDNIKDAIVDYILKNSTRGRNDWESILPDLFRRTEFVVLPRWDLISIPNQTDLSSLYKNMMNPKECLSFAKSSISFYDSAFIDDNTIVLPFDYKALSLVAVNGNTNVVEAAKLDKLFSDYVPIPSTSADFNRMTESTRNWILFMQKLVIVAETAQTYSAVPNTMRKQVRNGNLYISAMYNNINYLVAARSNKQLYPSVG